MRRTPLLSPRVLLPLFSAALVLGACGGSDTPSPSPEQPADTPPGELPPAPEGALTSDLSALDPLVIEVIEKARSAVRETPADGLLWGELGMAYHANDQGPPAIECYRHAAALQPAEARWPHLEALVLFDQGDVPGAIATMQTSIALDDRAVEALRHLGYWNLELAAYEKAEEAFLRALRVKAADAGARVGLAQVHLQRGEDAEALTILEEVAQLRPEDAYVSYVLSRAYRQAGHLMEAARLEQGNLDEQPSWWDPRWENAVEFRAQTFAVRYDLARTLYESARCEEALVRLDELYAENPTDLDVLNTMGQCYERLDRDEDAIRVAKECLALDPDNRDSLIRAGSLIGRRGDFEEGLAFLARAIELNPQDAGAYFARGSVLRRTEDLQGAIDAYRTSIGLDERNIGTWIAIARLESKLGRWDRGAEAFLKAESVGLVRGDIYLGLARCYMEMGRFDEAGKSLQESTKHPPTDKVRFNNLRNELQRRTSFRKDGGEGAGDGTDNGAGGDSDG